MARNGKTRSKKPSKEGPRGQRGPRGLRGLTGEMGKTGERGERGERGEAGQLDIKLGAVVLRVTQELEGVQQTLQVQFTRIAELQADLDDVRKAFSKLDEGESRGWVQR